MCGAAGSAATTGGGAEAVLADGVLRRSSGHLDLSTRCAEVLWSRYGGQRDPRVDGGEQTLGDSLTCDGGAVVDSGAVVAEAEGSGLGESPGAQAELRWG